jgi:hypothetical protein
MVVVGRRRRSSGGVGEESHGFCSPVVHREGRGPTLMWCREYWKIAPASPDFDLSTEVSIKKLAT